MDAQSQPQEAPPPSQPLPNGPMVSDIQGPRRRKLIILLVLLLLLALMGTAYYVVSGDEQSKTTTITTSEPQKTSLAAPKVELKTFATGLSVPTALVSTNIATDPRMFAVEQGGTVKIINQDGSIESEPFLDISSRVTSGGEMGLLGLAFSPKYADNGYFFVNYIDKSQNTVIARYRTSANDNKADADSEEIVLRLKQPYPNHNGGDLVFGKDGYLYIALGDGGSAGDPQNYAQNLTSLLGKILRLDVAQLPYAIPSSNPFANQPGKKGEIWSYGLRNPWRISFDRKTSDMYIADVGQGDKEEVNVEPSGSKGGANYGWRCYEGNKEFNTTGCAPSNQHIGPAFEYDHSQKRCSITGGYVYRGKKHPAMDGRYFYADYCTGEIFSAQKQADTWQSSVAIDSPYKISAFGEDSKGELYAADLEAGTVYRLSESTTP